MFEPVEFFFLLLMFFISFISSYFSIPKIIDFMEKQNYVGKDIHKIEKPEIPESGGLSTFIGFISGSFFIFIFFQEYINETIIFILTISIAALIGFLDDRIKLKSRYKIFLTLLSGLPLFFANIYGYIEISSPIIPFLGRTRLTIIYPFLIPLIVGIFTNTLNMLEGYNGEGSGTTLIVLVFLLINAIILLSEKAIIYIIPILAAIIPFFLYNKYPAKIFPGDIGTLTWGAAIAFIALLGSIEFPVVCALLLHIFNSFYVIFSVRGFVESSEVRIEKEDIILLEDNTIKASHQKDAALTIPRLILAKGPLREPKLVKNIWIISLICGLISLFGSFLIKWSVGELNFLQMFIISLIITISIGLFTFHYKRIRGIVFLIIFLFALGLLFMSFIDMFVMPYFTGIIDLLYLKIPVNILISLLISLPGLVGWYYITIKFFWSEIKKMKPG